ncbi:MAG TPA: hypothetical protein VHB48_17030 [Chitinophagaceae bacterium]|nr:hypothetical protein [Chitinophagaceae bacterium]
MKPASIRERLHTFIDVLPVAKITEIYYLLLSNYRDEFKLYLRPGAPDEEMTEDEVNLMVQQLLG